MSRADGIVHVPPGDEPDGTFYGECQLDEIIPDGIMCAGGCFHFIKDRDDETVTWHNGEPYCDDCFAELEVLPSEVYWEPRNRENWIVDDQDSYYGEDAE